MEREKAYAKAISTYANKWVVLVGRKVVASGETLREVQQAVEKKRIKKCVYHCVPPSSVSLAASCI